MIKLLVSDYDGTLMPYGDKRITEGVARGLRTLLDRGVTVAVSSGRTYGELSKFLPEFRDECYFICCDGAYYVKDGKVLYGRQMLQEDLMRLERERRDGECLMMHCAYRNYTIGEPPAEDAEWLESVPVRRMWDIKEPVYKVTAYGVKKELGPQSTLRMHWEGSGHSCSQIVNRYCDKGAALSDLQIRLMLTKFDTACMGDSGNDLAMVHNAKIAICVGNRNQAMRKACMAHFDRAEDALRFLVE